MSKCFKSAKWVIPEKIQTGEGEGGGGRLRTYFFEKYPQIFQICHFTLGNSRQNEALPLEIPQDCVIPTGMSTVKNKDPWNFHILSFQYPWKFHVLSPPPFSPRPCLDFFWNNIKSTFQLHCFRLLQIKTVYVPLCTLQQLVRIVGTNKILVELTTPRPINLSQIFQKTYLQNKGCIYCQSEIKTLNQKSVCTVKLRVQMKVLMVQSGKLFQKLLLLHYLIQNLV